jgi:hypothetical protein
MPWRALGTNASPRGFLAAFAGLGARADCGLDLAWTRGMVSRSLSYGHAAGWLVALAAGSCLAGCAAAAEDEPRLQGSRLQESRLQESRLQESQLQRTSQEHPQTEQQSAALAVDQSSLAAAAGPGAPGWQLDPSAALAAVSSTGIATDMDGNVALSGYTLGALDDATHASSDAFLAEYSAAGVLRWSAALASADSEAAAGVSTDASGNIFIAGDTSGALDGAALGRGDAFLAKYSSAGALEWTRQIGTPDPDAAAGVSADASGNVFVAGFTRGTLQGERQGSDLDVWAAKYSASGDPVWIQQLGSSPGYDERAAAVSADAEGNVFVAGHSFGSLDTDNRGSADAFVAKLSENGELLWLQQLGATGYDAAQGLSADLDGNVYVVGQLAGVLSGGPGVVIPGHPFVAKYSAAGERLWSLELMQAALGAATSVSTDADGDAFIAGYTSAGWGGPHRGLYDSFVARVSAAGELLWVLQPGLEELDEASGVSADTSGHVYISRNVWNLGADGSDQAFLLGFDAQR